MSTTSRILQFTQLYQTFRDLYPERIFDPLPSHGDFDGPNPEESRDSLKFIMNILNPLIKDDSLKLLPWHTLNGMQNVMQNVYNTFIAYQSSRDQGSYQNFAANIDSMVYHLRMFGVVQLAIGEGKIEQVKVTIDKELERLIINSREVDALKSEVRRLITPAVAGSLSEAFTSRRNALLKGRIVWALIALLGGGASIWATFSFASAVSNALVKSLINNTTGVPAWPIAMIRSVILIPAYSAFGLAFSQYKKERDFEEEYAHKAAVATSLPNYGDLAREPAVRDQIVTGATNVIFTSPTSQPREKERTELSITGVKDLVDSITKLVSKKD